MDIVVVVDIVVYIDVGAEVEVGVEVDVGVDINVELDIDLGKADVDKGDIVVDNVDTPSQIDWISSSQDESNQSALLWVHRGLKSTQFSPSLALLGWFNHQLL